MGKKSFRKRGKPSGNMYSHDEDNDVEKNQSGNKLTYMSAPTTSDESTKYTTFERIKEKIELRLPKDTTTEEGATEGSDTYDQGTTPEVVLMFVPSYDRSKDYGCLLYTSPSPRDLSTSRMPSSA